ncbi:MAG TPA: hypothetical protein EYP93_04470, partial [Gammaproteobacteria bacterium]|nr:hypothetical protein [Gammaproteobacteria bacterium]
SPNPNAKKVKGHERSQSDYKTDVEELESELRASERKKDEYEEIMRAESQNQGRNLKLEGSQIKEYHKLKEKSGKDAARYMSELDSSNREHESVQDRLDTEMRKKHEIESKLKTKGNELEESQKRLDKLTEHIRGSENQLEEQQKVFDDLNGDVGCSKDTIAKLQEELDRVTSELGDARVDKHEENRRKKKQEIVENFKRLYPGVFDRLINMSQPIHKKYNVAITKQLGRYVEAIVVDTESTARQCIQYLKDQMLEPETFLPLDYIQAKPLKDRLRNITNPRGVKLLYDVLRFDPPDIKRAVLFVTNNALVCESPDDAMKVAYELEDGQRYDAVALDGTFYQKSGIISGGSVDLAQKAKRWDDKQVSTLKFEKVDGGLLNRRATVKEYSRSSADQDIPLLHELRPSNVLRVAMDHLLCNVIDRIDSVADHGKHSGTMREWYEFVMQGSPNFPSGFNPWRGDPSDVAANAAAENVGDWFEYMWSTTRAVRKDITQQDLTKDPVAVDLIEKCARFHIMCAERLIEEESHNFEPKLNNENLTKCIQTLKHMYYDLSLEAERCHNEAEFRAYDVLLNLNDGDTLRKVQTLEPHILFGDEIRFVVMILAALVDNNYVKFFKLTRQATLLQGCILLRYFDQVRQKALKTLEKAYCPIKNQKVHFSLAKLTGILAFEDVQACARFCRAHGIESEIEDDTVYMEKASFFYPESIEASRARNLIESKRRVSWSVVINGGLDLPPNPYLTYVPHDSFDRNGCLKREAYEAADQATNKMSPKDKANLRAKHMLEATLSQIADDLIVEVVQREAIQVGQGVMRNAVATEVMRNFADEVEASVVRDLSSKLAADVIREARNEELARRLQSEAKLAEQAEVPNRLTDDLLAEIVLDMAKDVATQEMFVVERSEKLLKYFALIPAVVDELAREVIDNELIVPIARKTLADALNERDLKVELLRQRISLKLARRKFNAWRRYVQKRKSQRQIMGNFPSMPSTKSLCQQFKSILPKKNNLAGTERVRNDVDRLHEAIELEDKALEMAILKPLDLDGAVLEPLAKRKISHWKLIISAPLHDQDQEQQRGQGLCDLIKRKVSWSPPSEDDRNVLACLTKASVSICVRFVDKPILMEEIAFMNAVLSIVYDTRSFFRGEM